MKRVSVDVEEIVRLYVAEGLRASAIARRFGCGQSVVYARLEAAGVPRSRRARLDRDDVAAQYVAGASTAAIGREYGVAPGTIARHLRQWGIPMRSHAESLQPIGRVACPRSGVLRGYMLGFAWGDLAVDAPQGRGTTVAVRGSTTHEAQITLVEELFSPFGKVMVSRGETSACIRASLDPSFSFLLEKYGDVVPAWIRGPAVEAAFAAGYIDAEGSFGVYDGRARFKLDSFDVPVHSWLEGWMGRIGVPAVAKCIERQGPRANGAWLGGDLYRINVNEGLGLRRLVATVEPFSRHARRRATMAGAAQNVVDRMRARVAA